jgi:uncharacterized protein with GYD domain
MPLYKLEFSYTADAWKALAGSPQDRREPVRRLMDQLGGRLIELYYSMGEYDGFVIFEAPDNVAASAGAIAATMPGHIRATRTTPIFTVDETMNILRQAGKTSLQAPGGD